jgi:hypothetical protein
MTDGVIKIRKNRLIGIEVTLELMSKEDESCRWQTACDHGFCVGHRTRKIAESFIAVPWEWCEECLKLFEKKTSSPAESSRSS